MSGFFYGHKKSIRLGRKIIYFFSCLILFLFVIINPVCLRTTQVESCNKVFATSFPSIKQIVKNLFYKKDNITPASPNVTVYVGGQPLGFTFNCSGVLVIAISNKETQNLCEGDIITKIEDYDVNNVSEIDNILNNKIETHDSVKLTILRKEIEETATIRPIFDEKSRRYKLGIWIRDNAAGVGTLTFVRKDNLRFGALGHPVCDIDTGSIMPVSEGNIYKCNIVGFRRGTRNKPGELKGLFLRNGSIFGNLDKNIKFGVYGNFSEKYIDFISGQEMEVAGKNEVKSGKATIRCTIDGYEPQEYEIEIVKTYFQTDSETKSMFIRVIDKELLEKTGGIVQGMSGSPIIQNGKLVGAVTHVFVSDPTKGYGIFAETMIDK